MGWNRLEFLHAENPLFAGLEAGHVYFVHSYHALTESRERSAGGDGLRTSGYSHCRQRIKLRHAVPPGEKRRAWHEVAR